MKIGHATGLQVAFLMYAVMLLAVPLTNFLDKTFDLGGVTRVLNDKGMHFLLAGVIFAAFPKLRRFARDTLSRRVPPAMRQEVAIVALGKLALAFAVPAALVLWFWWMRGPAGIERVVANPDRDIREALSAGGLVRLGLMVLVAPIVEELIFRGFIFQAFDRQWGWFRAMLATSVLFGFYHSYFWSAFASSVVFVCVLRRTGTLWSSIVVHMVFNLMLWWPLLGQHVFPQSPVHDLSEMYFHFACLAFVAIAIPVYAWMARDRDLVAPTVFISPDAAVSK